MADTGIPINEYMGEQVQNPELPAGGELTPILQQVQNNELLNGTSSTLNPTGAATPQATPVVATPITQTTATAGQADLNAATSQVDGAAATYDATKIGDNAAQGTAAQGTVNPLDTVKGQLEQLYAETQPGQTPTWAKGAVVAANDMLAARGLGASSIGATAITAAVQQSALNIAAKDASTYFGMNIANLNNQQQMAMQNLQNRQQALLSDQAADNASKQFNAASTAQTQQFMATLVSNINNQNADRMTAIEQFNAAQANQLATTNEANSLASQTFNEQQKRAINEFNSTLQHQYT